MRKKGYKIAYVSDGAGNIQRATAVDTILKNSDCSVTLNTLDRLVKFLQEVARGALE